MQVELAVSTLIGQWGTQRGETDALAVYKSQRLASVHCNYRPSKYLGTDRSGLKHLSVNTGTNSNRPKLNRGLAFAPQAP